MRARVLVLSAVLAGCGASERARAQSSAANAGSGAEAKAPAGPGLSEAQKEFDAIKASRDPALPLKADLPRMSAPEFHGGASPTPRANPTTKSNKARAETKSKNWLVDAMQKPAEAREGRGRLPGELNPERDESGSTSNPDAASLFAAEDSRREPVGKRSEEPARKNSPDAPKEAVVNPLNRFLGEWMSPQDYALLKPGLTAAATDSPLALNPTPGVTPPALPADVTVPGPIGSAAGLPRMASGLPSGTPRENPFLQSLSPPVNLLPASPATSVPKPVLTTPAVVAPTVSAPSVVSPALPGKIPDFARPAADDKYFKQLKRF